MPQDVGVARRRAHRARAAARPRPGAAARRGRSGCSRPSASSRARRRRPAGHARSARRSATGPSSAATSSRASGTRPAGGSSARGFDEVGDRPATTLSRRRAQAARARRAVRLRRARPAARRARQLPRRPGQARRWRRRSRPSKKTVLLISHDRELLAAACDAIVTLEGNGAGCTAARTRTYPEAREQRQQKLLGDRLRAVEATRSAPARARADLQGAGRSTRGLARSGPTRWRRAGSASSTPGRRPRPSTDQQIKVRMRGGDSARRVVDLKAVGIDGLVRPVRRGGPLRRARRADRAERLRQDAPDAPARRRGRRARRRAA